MNTILLVLIVLAEWLRIMLQIRDSKRIDAMNRGALARAEELEREHIKWLHAETDTLLDMAQSSDAAREIVENLRVETGAK